jgi:hypothetical protein
VKFLTLMQPCRRIDGGRTEPDCPRHALERPRSFGRGASFDSRLVERAAPGPPFRIGGLGSNFRCSERFIRRKRNVQLLISAGIGSAGKYL